MSDHIVNPIRKVLSVRIYLVLLGHCWDWCVLPREQGYRATGFGSKYQQPLRFVDSEASRMEIWRRKSGQNGTRTHKLEVKAMRELLNLDSNSQGGVE